MSTLTTTEIRARLKVISPLIQVLGEYKGNRSKLKCECKRHGMIWFPTWEKLRIGRGCPQCGKEKNVKNLKLTHEEVIARLSQISPGVQLLSKYTRAHNLLKCKCVECDNTWRVNWNNLSQGHGCPQCSMERSINGTRFSLDRVKEKLKKINSTIKITGREYENARSKLECECQKCDYTWNTTWASLRSGRSCPKCNFPYHKSEDEVRELLEKLTGHYFPKATPSEVPWLHGLYLDGFCPNLKTKNFPNGTAFEYQGPHHYQLTHWKKFSRGALVKQKRNDWRKKFQCYKHGVRLIRIPYNLRDVESYLEKRVR